MFDPMDLIPNREPLPIIRVIGRNYTFACPIAVLRAFVPVPCDPCADSSAPQTTNETPTDNLSCNVLEPDDDVRPASGRAGGVAEVFRALSIEEMRCLSGAGGSIYRFTSVTLITVILTDLGSSSISTASSPSGVSMVCDIPPPLDPTRRMKEAM